MGGVLEGVRQQVIGHLVDVVAVDEHLVFTDGCGELVANLAVLCRLVEGQEDAAQEGYDVGLLQ